MSLFNAEFNFRDLYCFIPCGVVATLLLVLVPPPPKKTKKKPFNCSFYSKSLTWLCSLTSFRPFGRIHRERIQLLKWTQLVPL